MDVLESKDTTYFLRDFEEFEGPDFPQISTQKAISVVKSGVIV